MKLESNSSFDINNADESTMNNDMSVVTTIKNKIEKQFKQFNIVFYNSRENPIMKLFKQNVKHKQVSDNEDILKINYDLKNKVKRFYNYFNQFVKIFEE